MSCQCQQCVRKREEDAELARTELKLRRLFFGYGGENETMARILASRMLDKGYRLMLHPQPLAPMTRYEAEACDTQRPSDE